MLPNFTEMPRYGKHEVENVRREWYTAVGWLLPRMGIVSWSCRAVDPVKILSHMCTTLNFHNSKWDYKQLCKIVIETIMFIYIKSNMKKKLEISGMKVQYHLPCQV